MESVLNAGRSAEAAALCGRPYVVPLEVVGTQSPPASSDDFKKPGWDNLEKSYHAGNQTSPFTTRTA